jgi:response regulator RpfG family c-di-GMP phosphodiesterase
VQRARPVIRHRADEPLERDSGLDKTMSEKILLVDDEPNVLRACERLLHNRFETDAAVGGAEALRAIQNTGPYAVVLSDMRMPQMDGIQLLMRVKAQAPDTVRIMLTGYADVQTALSAVNDGNIFRFLTKPCSKQTLINALSAGVAQYRLVTSEKDVLEKTLAGSLTVLTEVLSMASPAAFSRAMRLKRYMTHVTSKLGLANRWKFELAAMLSQVGCVTMAPETVDAVYAGQALPPKEQALYDSHPQIAWDLLRNIPRMESIAWMIAHQNDSDRVEGDINDAELAERRFGSRLLEATISFDARVRKGTSRTEAAFAVGRQIPDLDERVTMALVEVEPEAYEKDTRNCRIEEILPGMIVEKDVRTENGFLVIARNQEVTPSVILKLKNYYEKAMIVGDIAVSTGTAAAAAKK